ncbi:MAG: PEP-CTERM sorting domain-containing protein [Chthoniobacterales bacterium]
MKRLFIGITLFAGLIFLPLNSKAQTVYSASEDLSLFGYLYQKDPQITAALGKNGCNPTSWVNALNYFQNVNSSYFGTALVGTSYQDWINADLTLSGPKYLNTTSASGTSASAIIPGLQNYFSDLGFSGLSITMQMFPTWNQLYQNLVSSTATQLILAPFQEDLIGHAVSLGAINWDAENPTLNTVSFIDPDKPTIGSDAGAVLSTASFINYTDGPDTVIAFYYPGSQNGYYIQKAFVVSIPEPSTYMLFGIGSICMLMVMRRKKVA